MTQALENTAVAATSPDRMGFILCLAVALHAAAILGIGFSEEMKSRSAPRLEITLAQHQSENRDADFLAQMDQAGSGTLEEKALLTQTENSPFRDTEISDPRLLQVARARPLTSDLRLISSTRASEQLTEPTKSEDSQAREARHGDEEVDQLNREIASLEAKLDIQRQAYANRPRVRHLSSMSTRRAVDAEYLHHWRTRVELIGNRNYPEQARNQGLEGSLRMLVALFPDGSIKGVEILQSSGHPILDAAARRIVYLSAPFEPFPAEMRREVDILEIIRTWRFEQSVLVSSG